MDSTLTGPSGTHRLWAALLLSISLLACSESTAQFHRLESENLRLLYYDEQHAYVIPHLRRCFENSLAFHRRTFGYTPSEKVTILLQDFDDYGYAGATGLPFNYMILGIEPYEYVYETSPTNERLNWVMSHELMHVVATDKPSSADRLYRSIFLGKVSPSSDNPVSMFYSYLTVPRKYSPRWYHEGIAVFMETWMAGGIGRVLGGYDEMVFRTMVRDSSYFFDVVGLESEGTTIDFQTGQNSYLYGTRFVTYLADRYGIDKLLSWFNRTDDSKQYFASQFDRVYGVSLDDEWSRWIEWEHGWQEANLDSVRHYPVTPYRRIARGALGAISRAYYDSTSRRMYAAVNFPGQLAHIAAINIDDGSIEHICDVPSPAMYYVCSLAYDPSTENLFFTTHNNKDWRDLNVVNVKTHDSRVLLKRARTGDLAFDVSRKSIWGIQHHNGLSTLVRFAPPYDRWSEVLHLPYGRDMFDIDISPDGTTLSASTIEVSGKQQLIRMPIEELLKGNSAYEVCYEFVNNSPENFVFSIDGKYLFGTSYYTGVSNVFRYDLDQKKMEAISNCETGFFRPVQISRDSVAAFRYTGKGFVPVMLANRTTEDVSPVRYLGQDVVEKYPVLKTWTLPSPLSVGLDTIATDSGSYNGLGSLRLTSMYPVVEGYKDYTSIGLRWNFLDPLLYHDLDLTGSYSPSPGLPENERVHLSLNYRFWQWKISATLNRADFYDLFGPTKESRKGYSLGVQYTDLLLSDNPRVLDYTISLNGYGNLERLPDFQNVATSFDRFLTAGGKLSYRYLRRSLGGVEAEQGIRTSLNLLNTYVNSSDFFRGNLNLDYGVLLPIDHSSLWFRGSAGASTGDRDNPFANFFFGGFGNNWVDFQDVKRYRESYSFPGTELNSIGGTNYGKVTLEWVLPPLRFRRLGFLSLYCNWSQLSLFASGIGTNLDRRDEGQTLVDAGGQIDFKLVVFSRLESTLSFGYAAAFERDERPTREFMFSLKIL
jgi:hypothetical protein